MRILNSGDIMETIEMLTNENLDVRTVTMGISLLDCIDPDGKAACEKIYNKIVSRAKKLVPVVDAISATIILQSYMELQRSLKYRG